MRRTSKAVGSAASNAAAAVIKRCAAGPVMAAGAASAPGMLSSADFVSDEAAQAAAQVCLRISTTSR